MAGRGSVDEGAGVVGFVVADAVGFGLMAVGAVLAVEDGAVVVVAVAVGVSVAVVVAVAVALPVVTGGVSVGLGSLHPAKTSADETSTATESAEGAPAQKGHALAA
ncbi:hypothetical protein BH09MYX1_BH09MYX1_54150 [soil metagenome]